MHDDGDQQVEEDSGDVFDACLVERHLHGLSGSSFNGEAHVVVQGDEEAGQRVRHLEHEAHNEHHGKAGHDVRMVLNDELVREDRRVLGRGAAPDNHLDAAAAAAL